MNNMKRISISILGIVLLLAATWFLISNLSRKSDEAPARTTIERIFSKPDDFTSKNFDPKNPNFIFGKVISVSSSNLLISRSGVANVILLTSDTVFVKQVKDGEVLKNIEATLADIKQDQEVVVYFNQPPQDGVYSTYKIQIISN